jgi:hypothetical protein
MNSVVVEDRFVEKNDALISTHLVEVKFINH